jgi:hypothetical protein
LTFTAGSGNTVGNVLAYVNITAEGTHTVMVTVRNSSGSTFTDTWDFRIAIPPVLGAPTPAANTIVATSTPFIEIPASDNGSVTGWSATVNGAPAPAAFDGMAGKIRVTSPVLTNDETSTVSVTIRDGIGLSTTTTWSFFVQTQPDMLNNFACASCHVGYEYDLDMGPGCLNCHMVDGKPQHSGTPTSLHPAPDVSACKPCHVAELTVEHNRRTDASGAQVTCVTCHDSTSPVVIDAIRTGNTECAACHGTIAASHLASVDHTATPAPANFTILGADLGTHNCSECHSMRLAELHTLNGQPNCNECHPMPRKSFTTWNRGCVQGGCHSAGSSAPMHSNLNSAHSVAAQSCTIEGCHTGSGNLAALHSSASTTTAGVTRSSCQICHAAGVTPSATCSDCHNMSNAHGISDTTRHTTSLASGQVVLSNAHDDGTPAIVQADCTMCHSASLLTQHGNDCQLCHASTDPAIKAAIASYSGDCAQCHTPYHVHADAGHGSANVDCGSCHDHGAPYANVGGTTPATAPWCGQCHLIGADTSPPSTSMAPAGPMVGPVTIKLTATDNSGARGVKATYFVLDGASRSKGTTVALTPPPSGSQSHTLEYWSVDYAGNKEATKTASFTISPDITPPVTSSDATATYYMPATIHLTAIDNASDASMGVVATYYRIDGGPQTSGASLSVIPPLTGTESHTLSFWSVDGSGNVEEARTVLFDMTADITPPTTSTSIGAYVNQSYFLAYFTPVDPTPGSGVATVRATSANIFFVSPPTQVDASTWAVSVNMDGISRQGVHTLQYSAVDKAGNAEATKTVTFIADWTAPVTTTDAHATYTGTAVINLGTSDVGGSSVARTYYKLDSAPAWSVWSTGSPIVVAGPPSGSQSHQLYCYSVDNAGNVESGATPKATFTVVAGSSDTTPPVGTNSINNGAAYTATTGVSLTSTMTDSVSSVVTMAVDPTGTGVSWTNVHYSPTHALTLPAGDGVKTVLSKYQDGAGNWTDVYTNTIVLDTTAPTGTMAIDGGSLTTTSLAGTIDSAMGDVTSGLGQMRVDLTGTGSSYGAWTGYVPSYPIALSPPTGIKTVLVQFRDNAGNIATQSDTITLTLPADTNPPTGVMSINHDSATVTSRNVSVDSTVTDDTWGVDQMRVDPGSGTYGAWLPYSQALAITLTSGDGTKTVSVQYRDYSGNILKLTDAVALHETLQTAMLAFRWHPAGEYAAANLHVEDVNGNTIASSSLEGVGVLDWVVTVPVGRYKMVVDYYYVDSTGEEGGGYYQWTDATTPGQTYTWWY